MNYDLALKLKNAGFPQENKQYYYISGLQEWEGLSHSFHNTSLEKGQYFYGSPIECANPTLSELIEACGSRFVGILRSPESLGGGWDAGEELGYSDFDTDKCCSKGKTPEEAVALLYISLQNAKIK